MSYRLFGASCMDYVALHVISGASCMVVFAVVRNRYKRGVGYRLNQVNFFFLLVIAGEYRLKRRVFRKVRLTLSMNF